MRRYTYIGSGHVASHQEDGIHSLYCHDTTGNTSALANTGGSVTDRYAYTFFGVLLSHSGPSTTPRTWMSMERGWMPVGASFGHGFLPRTFPYSGVLVPYLPGTGISISFPSHNYNISIDFLIKRQPQVVVDNGYVGSSRTLSVVDQILDYAYANSYYYYARDEVDEFGRKIKQPMGRSGSCVDTFLEEVGAKLPGREDGRQAVKCVIDCRKSNKSTGDVLTCILYKCVLKKSWQKYKDAILKLSCCSMTSIDGFTDPSRPGGSFDQASTCNLKWCICMLNTGLNFGSGKTDIPSLPAPISKIPGAEAAKDGAESLTRSLGCMVGIGMHWGKFAAQCAVDVMPDGCMDHKFPLIG